MTISQLENGLTLKISQADFIISRLIWKNLIDESGAVNYNYKVFHANLIEPFVRQVKDGRFEWGEPLYSKDKI